MTSSAVGVIGTSTQSAYCAANAFRTSSLFSVAQKARQLPTSLDLGLGLEVGSVSQLKNIQQSLHRVATYGQSETEFVQLVEEALCAAQDDTRSYNISEGHINTGLEPRRFVAQRENDGAHDLVWSSAAMMTTQKNRPVSAKLAAAASQREKMVIIQEAIAARVSELLGINADEINTNKAMSNYGLDSIVVPELQN
ncbi:hypothetical protein F5Y08DRAFT_342610 [Xylaria arbuscula]|nr:hypothetical protein F5Y08DRAFT_342610 [Xylaria arbuscula]